MRWRCGCGEHVGNLEVVTCESDEKPGAFLRLSFLTGMRMKKETPALNTNLNLPLPPPPPPQLWCSRDYFRRGGAGGLAGLADSAATHGAGLRVGHGSVAACAEQLGTKTPSRTWPAGRQANGSRSKSRRNRHVASRRMIRSALHCIVSVSPWRAED